MRISGTGSAGHSSWAGRPGAVADDKPQYEYTVVVRDVGSTRDAVNRDAIKKDDGHTGAADLEGVAGGARDAQEAAAEASMILQSKLGLTPIARDR